jgi:hypothetical protein
MRMGHRVDLMIDRKKTVFFFVRMVNSKEVIHKMRKGKIEKTRQASNGPLRIQCIRGG